MKKRNILNLIKYHAEKDDDSFRNEAYEIARYFDQIGDFQLAQYIMSLMSNANIFVPQSYERELLFLKKTKQNIDALPLPDSINSDVLGIVNAVAHNAGVNKFLFVGVPGTGKTETAKQIARILDREIFIVQFDMIVDSKLGQTSKNIALLFEEIDSFSQQEKIVILFDEIDAIAMNRTNSNDLREMGRATSAVLKGLDDLSEKVVLIATTNLYDSFDKALTRRFDSIIDFNRYTKEDLIDVAENILTKLLIKFKKATKNKRLFRKIMNLSESLPYPGELNNLLKTSLAFSNPDDGYDYLRRLLTSVIKKDNIDLKSLQEKGFSIREMEILTGISRSQISRELKELGDE